MKSAATYLANLPAWDGVPRLDELTALSHADVAQAKKFMCRPTGVCVPAALEKSLPPLDRSGADPLPDLTGSVTWPWPDAKSLRIAAEFLRRVPAPAEAALWHGHCRWWMPEWIAPKAAIVLRLRSAMLAVIRAGRRAWQAVRRLMMILS